MIDSGESYVILNTDLFGRDELADEQGFDGLTVLAHGDVSPSNIDLVAGSALFHASAPLGVELRCPA